MDFSQQLQAQAERANRALQHFIGELPFQKSPLVEAMLYGTLLGGKRLRPFLVYATGEMFGVNPTALWELCMALRGAPRQRQNEVLEYELRARVAKKLYFYSSLPVK